MKTSIKLEPHWIIDAPAEEMRLILKALGGRLTPDDVQPARELGDRITKQRADLASTLSSQMHIHKENIRD